MANPTGERAGTPDLALRTLARFTAGMAEKPLAAFVQPNWVTAFPAKSMMARTDAVLEGDALVENEALAPPKTIGWQDPLDVIQDATAELVDVPETSLKEVGAGLLAPDASSAEDRNFSQLVSRQLTLDKVGKLTEYPRLRIACAFECSNLDLIVIASIDKDYIWLAYEGIPIFRFDARGGSLHRLRFRASKRHDLALDLHFEPLKGVGGRLGEFYLQI